LLYLAKSIQIEDPSACPVCDAESRDRAPKSSFAFATFSSEQLIAGDKAPRNNRIGTKK